MRHAAVLFGEQSAETAVRPSRRLVMVLALIAAASMSMSLFFTIGRAFQYHDRDEGPNTSYAIELYQGTLPTINTRVPTKGYPMLASGATKYTMKRFHAAHAAATDSQVTEAHRLGLDDAPESVMAKEFWEYQVIWTANHPPLYYLLGVPWVALANAVHVPVIVIVGMRLVSALAFGLTMLLIGLIAFEVTPRRPAAAVLATSIASSCAVLAAYAGYVSNDTVAAAGSSLTVLATLRILRLGVTRNRLLLLALAGTAAAATKAPGVITVVMCAAALGVTLLLRNRTRKGLLRATGVAAVAAGVPGLAIGWFYVRNIMLYGDPTASSALLTRYQRSSIGSWVDIMLSPRFWHGWYDSLWIPFPLHGHWVHDLLDGATLIALVGLLLGILARIRDHYVHSGTEVPDAGSAVVSAEPSEAAAAPAAAAPAAAAQAAEGPVKVPAPRRRVRVPWSPSVATVALLVLIAHAVVILINLAQFRAGGGQAHERYLLTVLPLISIVLSIGALAIVDGLPIGEVRRREEIATAVLTTVVMAFAAVMFAKLVQCSPGYARLLALRPLAFAFLGLGALAGIGGVLGLLVPRPARDGADSEGAAAGSVRVIEPRTAGDAGVKSELVG